MPSSIPHAVAGHSLLRASVCAYDKEDQTPDSFHALHAPTLQLILSFLLNDDYDEDDDEENVCWANKRKAVECPSDAG